MAFHILLLFRPLCAFSDKQHLFLSLTHFLYQLFLFRKICSARAKKAKSYEYEYRTCIYASVHQCTTRQPSVFIDVLSLCTETCHLMHGLLTRNNDSFCRMAFHIQSEWVWLVAANKHIGPRQSRREGAFIKRN